MTTTPDPHGLTVISQMIEAHDVVSIQETDAVQDEETGDWIRDMRIYRDPGADLSNPVLVLTVRLRGTSKENLYFHAPEQLY